MRGGLIDPLDIGCGERSRVDEGVCQDATVDVDSTRKLIEELQSVVGGDHVITDSPLMEPHCTDWTRRFGGPAVCVVRPGSTSEVSSVMRICADAGVPVLPQGGNTGLVGGSVPAGNEQGSAGAEAGDQATPPPVIVSLRRLDWIADVEADSA